MRSETSVYFWREQEKKQAPRRTAHQRCCLGRSAVKEKKTKSKQTPNRVAEQEINIENKSRGKSFTLFVWPREEKKQAPPPNGTPKVLPRQKRSFFSMVEMSGLEPPTPTLSGWCSNRLSYISISLQNPLGICSFNLKDFLTRENDFLSIRLHYRLYLFYFVLSTFFYKLLN